MKLRAGEEREGHIRWLRPEYQNPAGAAPTQTTALDEGDEETPAPAAPALIQPWPKAMAEQARVVRTALERLGAPATVEDIAQGFKGAKRERVQELLETLASLGQCRKDEQGRYAG